MSDPKFDALIDQLRQIMADCRRLYVDSARDCIQQQPHLIRGSHDDFLRMMEDLHCGLLIKIYVMVSEADWRWCEAERRVAEELFEHLWGRRLTGKQLEEAAARVSARAHELKWYSLIRPFDQVPLLRERVAELETVVMRMANLVAKADGQVSPDEVAYLRTIEDELRRHLRSLPIDEPTQHGAADRLSPQAIQQVKAESQQLRKEYGFKSQQVPKEETKTREERLAEVMAKLDGLIGLGGVKHEVRTLTNFLQLQRQREQAGMPSTQLSLHMVFSGNPGTGKTTVARILGDIFGAIGMLTKGHLVETDRSGLVAEFAGQTGPKTNKKVDEALDGVLFVDEAYSLVAETGDDPYGREAVQTLLKRMEDNRDRLIVILAGYPEPMESLLRSNPGLSSRFNTNLVFEDYKASELGRIFQTMCDKNHYDIPVPTQVKVLLGFKWLYAHRDQHFGNGRTVRNTFENAIRRLANRVAGTVPLTRELLARIHPEDVELSDIPAAAWVAIEEPTRRFVIQCPRCTEPGTVPTSYLGQRVVCKKCENRFIAAWGEPKD